MLVLALIIICGIDLLAGAFLIPDNDQDFRVPHPYYHHGLLPNRSQTTHWGGIPYQIHTNALGFRDAAVRHIPLQSDKYRILFMGDSHTEGVGIDFSESFTGLLTDKIDTTQIEILNAAAVSYSPKLYYYKTQYLLEEVGLDIDEIYVFMDISDIQNEYAYEAFEPHQTSFQDFLSDIERAIRKHSFVYYALRNIYLQHQQQAFYKAISKEQLAHNNTIDIYRTFFSHFNNEVLLNNPQFHTTVSEWFSDESLYQRWGKKGVGLMTENMQKLVTLCKQHKVALTITVHPWRNNVMRGEEEDRHVTYWRAFANENDIGFINLYPLFINEISPRKIIENYFIPYDNHWTTTGHQLVADKLFSFIGALPGTVAKDEYHYHQGIVMREQLACDSSLAHFTMAIDINPTTPQYFYQRGKTHVKAKNYTLASADFQQAWQLDTSFQQAKLAIGQVAAQQKADQYTEKLQIKETAYDYVQRGKALLQMNRHKRAYQDFEQAFALNPGLKEAYFYIGYIENQLMESPRDAIKYFNRAITLDSAYVEAYRARADAFMQIGAKAKALSDLQQVEQLGGETDTRLLEKLSP